MKRLKPVPPGEILAEEFLAPFGITNNQLAIHLGVPASRIDQIVKAKRAISADTALRLSMYFGTTAAFWLNLQTNYEVRRLEISDLESIRSQVRPREKSSHTGSTLEA